MAIQALSSVTNRGNSNISFEKRGEKPAKGSVSNVTSPLKAVPLAALIAMSPLNTTNAENIMRAENNANRIELAEAPQSREIIDGDILKAQNGTEVAVIAVNTKGRTDSFDKILLVTDGAILEAKDLLLREAYLYSSGDVKEGPLIFKEVVAEMELDGEKVRFSFLDQNIVNYVEAVVAQPTNQSNIKKMRHADLNLVVANSEGQFVSLTDEKLKRYLANSVLRPPNIPANGLEEDTTHIVYVTLYKAKYLEEKYIRGSNGNYTLRFYDSDGNPNNAEKLVLQKDGSVSLPIKGVTLVNGNLVGVDKTIQTGLTSVIRLATSPVSREEEYITDDILAEEIIKFYNSSKYNKSQEYPLTIKQTESYLVL